MTASSLNGFQVQVNQLLHGHARPDGQMGVLTESELTRMEIAHAVGWTPAEFVDAVLFGRARRATVAA